MPRAPKTNGKGPLSDDEIAFVERVAGDFARQFGEAFPQLREAVKRDGSESSFSCTLQVKKVGSARRGYRFEATLKPPTRAPMEQTVYDVRLDDGQLVLGFEEFGGPEAEGHEGEAAATH